MEDYEMLTSWCTPAYSYIEGDERETYWIDSQNCYYHVFLNETDEETDLRYDGKKYWIIEPYKPKGIIITKENWKEQIKWFVTFTSESNDTNKEWDFEKHICLNLQNT